MVYSVAWDAVHKLTADGRQTLREELVVRAQASGLVGWKYNTELLSYALNLLDGRPQPRRRVEHRSGRARKVV